MICILDKCISRVAIRLDDITYWNINSSSLPSSPETVVMDAKEKTPNAVFDFIPLGENIYRFRASNGKLLKVDTSDNLYVKAIGTDENCDEFCNFEVKSLPEYNLKVGFISLGNGNFVARYLNGVNYARADRNHSDVFVSYNLEIDPTCSRWIKVYQQNSKSGLFWSNLTDALYKNPDNPNADLYSILSKLENYRSRGAEKRFRFKLCYPELTWGIDGKKCNEWYQTSNPATDSNITGFEAIDLAFIYSIQSGQLKDWGGIGKRTDGAVICDDPLGYNSFSSIGSAYWNSGIPNTFPGPRIEPWEMSKSYVQKAELYVFY